MPPWFSGTNSKADGIVGTNTPVAVMYKGRLLINGTVVKQVTYLLPGGAPGPIQLDATFDSTYFAHGRTVTVRIPYSLRPAAFCLWTGAVPVAAADPALTEAQVIEIASTFCRRIGQPVTARATATFRRRRT
jgi:hypothetical protein